MFLIKIYQRTLSLDHGYLGKMFPNWRVCKFVPTCSQYFYESVKKHGSIKGTALGLRRISRCNGKTVAGTYDPVP